MTSHFHDSHHFILMNCDIAEKKYHTETKRIKSIAMHHYFKFYQPEAYE